MKKLESFLQSTKLFNRPLRYPLNVTYIKQTYTEIYSLRRGLNGFFDIIYVFYLKNQAVSYNFIPNSRQQTQSILNDIVSGSVSFKDNHKFASRISNLRLICREFQDLGTKKLDLLCHPATSVHSCKSSFILTIKIIRSHINAHIKKMSTFFAISLKLSIFVLLKKKIYNLACK